MKCLLVAALILPFLSISIVSGQTSDPAFYPPASPDDIQGLWVWRGRWITKPAERAELVAFCKRLGINRLLVQGSFIAGAEGNPILEFPSELHALIVDAATEGIAVEALDGARDMAVRENWPQTLAKLDALLAFNRTLPVGAKLAGIHYDIEPYLMKEWKQGDAQRETLMLNLLVFLDEAKKRIHQDDRSLTLAADIPFWYDNKTKPGDTCVLEYNGQVKNLHQHVQDICDYVGVMSYRRRATGGNSVEQVIENEINYAAQIGKFVVPALETIELKDDPQISFFGSTPEEFWKAHNQVRAAFGHNPGFGGMLTHSYDGMRNLHGNASKE